MLKAEKAVPSRIYYWEPSRRPSCRLHHDCLGKWPVTVPCAVGLATMSSDLCWGCWPWWYPGFWWFKVGFFLRCSAVRIQGCICSLIIAYCVFFLFSPPEVGGVSLAWQSEPGDGALLQGSYCIQEALFSSCPSSVPLSHLSWGLWDLPLSLHNFCHFWEPFLK